MSKSLYFVCFPRRERVWCGQGWTINDAFFYHDEQGVLNFLFNNRDSDIDFGWEEDFAVKCPYWYEEEKWHEYEHKKGVSLPKIKSIIRKLTT